VKGKDNNPSTMIPNAHLSILCSSDLHFWIP